MPAAKATEAAMKRAINAWKACGLAVGRMEITRDGTIRIETPVANAPESHQPKGPRAW